MAKNPKKRAILQAKISPVANDSIAETAERNCMTRVEVESRLFEWIARQSEEVQATILGLMPPNGKVDVAAEAIKGIQLPEPAKKRWAFRTTVLHKIVDHSLDKDSANGSER